MFPHDCKDHALFFQELYVPENLIHFKPIIVRITQSLRLPEHSPHCSRGPKR